MTPEPTTSAKDLPQSTVPGHSLHFFRPTMSTPMTTAPVYPPVHVYEGENPYEIVNSKFGRMERWRALAMATGEASALTELSKQVRNDAATIVARQDARDAALNARQDSLDQRERQIGVMAAQVSEMAGRMSVEWDKLQKAKADAAEEPLATPPGDPSDQSKEPEPALELEDAEGDPPDPDDPVTTEQAEFASGELPAPPIVQSPTAAGLDEEE